MTAESKAAVLTARRAAQHIRLFEPNDAYECLCILTVLPEPSPVSALCWQIHRRLAVLVPLLRVWVHCPRASNGLLPRRSNLVGYVQWGARFDRFLLCQTIMSSSFSGRSLTGFSKESNEALDSLVASLEARVADLEERVDRLDGIAPPY